MMLAAKPLYLRCKTKNGQHLIDSLTEYNSVEDFKAILFNITGINPNNLKIMIGYPPKVIDLTNDYQQLGSILPRQKETLIIEEISSTDDNRKIPIVNKKDFKTSNGILVRKVVPANNSCLFTSVYFSISGGELSISMGTALRRIIADTVAADKETYNQAFLGKPNREYCTWILNQEHWGGAIELSILSQYYQVEIVAVDTQNLRLNRFGEDRNYENRILLIYDGIHYDPLMLELDGKQCTTIFPTSDDTILCMALDVAREAKANRQYTDVHNFLLRCLVCKVGIQGEAMARQHAKETGHQDFDEI